MKRNKKTCPLSGIRSEWKDEIGEELDKFKEGITSSKFTPEIEAKSLAEKIKVEEFIQELKGNPYQLKMVI